MNKHLSALTLAAALLIGGTGCAVTEPAAASAPVTTPMEDDPGFNCLEHGNQICGPVMLTDALSLQAWDTFDAQDGARQVRVDPTRPFRVDLGRYSLDGKLQPRDGSLILVDRDGYAFEYTVTYTD